jgi:phage shock protein PspC (stress-responsive transcriptional regulator)
VGRYFGLDPNLVRVLWILSALLGGIGVLPYVAAVLIVPEEDAPDAEPAGPRADTARLVGLGLIAIGAFLLLRAFGIEVFRGRFFEFWTLGVLVPAALLLAGVFLVWPRARGAVGLSAGRKARRSVTDRIVAGVCGGLARELDVDANLVRVVFVLAAGLTSGFFVLVYLLLVLVLPEEEVVMPAAPTAAPGPPAPPAPPAPPPPGPGTSAPGGEEGGSSSGEAGPSDQGPEGDRR